MKIRFFPALSQVVLKFENCSPLAFVIAALVLSLFPQKSLAIVNGTKVPLGEHTEVAKMFGMNKEHTAFWRCSGVFISERDILSAGHCLQNIDQNTIYLLSRDGKELKPPIHLSGYTEFTDDLHALLKAKPQDPEAVEGCTIHPAPLVRTKTADFSLLRVDGGAKTEGSIAKINRHYHAKEGQKISVIGYGTEWDPLDPQNKLVMAGEDPLSLNKNIAQATIWKSDEQRLSIKTSEMGQFAADGDSGSPVYDHKGKVVAIMSTFQPHCETKLGGDYGPLNTASLLNNDEARGFLTRAKAYLDAHPMVRIGTPEPLVLKPSTGEEGTE